jgi:hypothetical protein
MITTILITEKQQKKILIESTNKDILDIVTKNDSLVKKIVKDASNQIKFDLSILATFSTTIGGLMGPLNQLLEGKYPDLTPLNVSLILAGVGFQYIKDNSEPLKKIIKKIKEDGLVEPFKECLSKAENLKNSFLEFVESLGVSVKKTANIMGFTVLIPIIPIIYNLINELNLNETDIVELIKRIFVFAGLNYTGSFLEEMILSMVRKFKNK